MEREEIEEGNKLLAAFDGITIGVSIYSWRPGCQEPIQEHHLNYHASWGWIMPLVEKIEKGDYGFKMCRKVVEVYVDSTKEVLFKTKESCRLNSLYKAVVEFIKWHNANILNK